MDGQEQVELFRQRTMDVILALRAQYLAMGGNSLTHWDQIAARATGALRTTTTAAQWTSEVLRRLRIVAPSSSLSLAMVALEADVDGRGLSATWRLVMRRELPVVIAEARLEAEARQKARKKEMDNA